MPLKAILNQATIYSFQYPPAEWSNLKSFYKMGNCNLTMHCCGSPAIPKTSSQGLQFFSHKLTGDCTSQAESQEHEFVKFEVAKAIHKLGWQVETEKSGVSQYGDEWRADVYCSKGDVKIAFEVQHSRQIWEQIEKRQQRYKDSNVRCCWLLNGNVFKCEMLIAKQSKRIPAFSYTLKEVGIPTKMDCFRISAGEFSTGLLQKKLRWHNHKPKGSVDICEHHCWKCGKLTRSLIGLTGTKFRNGVGLSARIAEAKRYLNISILFYKNQKIGYPLVGKFPDGSLLLAPTCYSCKTIQEVHQLAELINNFLNPTSSKASPIVRIFNYDLAINNVLVSTRNNHWKYSGLPYTLKE